MQAAATRIAQGHAVAEQPPAAPMPTSAADDDDDDTAPADAPLPLGDDEFPVDILALICSFLGLRGLGRLACAAPCFTEPTLTEPGGGAGGAKLKLSPIEEGARLRLAAAMVAGGSGSGGGGASGGGVAAVRLTDETWMRALWRVQYHLLFRRPPTAPAASVGVGLLFTSCGPGVVLHPRCRPGVVLHPRPGAVAPQHDSRALQLAMRLRQQKEEQAGQSERDAAAAHETDRLDKDANEISVSVDEMGAIEEDAQRARPPIPSRRPPMAPKSRAPSRPAPQAPSRKPPSRPAPRRLRGGGGGDGGGGVAGPRPPSRRPPQRPAPSVAARDAGGGDDDGCDSSCHSPGRSPPKWMPPSTPKRAPPSRLALSAELVDQTADDEPTVADGDDALPADAPLPLGSDEFPDEVLAVVCRFLGLRGLGRLACVARRFTEPTLTEPGGAKLLSPIEEGARLRLAAAAAGGGGGG
eukprot:COSAG06_NODE_4745_length_3984_cov_1.280864_4_plen_466_part_01